MNLQQKEAVSTAVSFVIFGVLAFILYRVSGSFETIWLVSSVFLGNAVLMAWWHRKESKSGRVLNDERDKEIRNRAMLLAYSVAILALGTVGGCLFLKFGVSGQIPVIFLPAACLGFGLVVTLVYLLITITSYYAEKVSEFKDQKSST